MIQEAAIQQTPGACKQYLAGKAFEESARNYTEITFLLFAVNLALIFTGRFVVRDNPWEINILGKTIIEFEEKIDSSWIVHIDRILFTISFTIISILTVLQFVPFGIVRGG